MALIELKNIVKSYGDHKVLDNINFTVNEGDMTAIVGASGKGKSTFMNIVGLIEKYDSGELIICGEKKIYPNTKKSAKMIRDNISYLFQNFALVDNETVEQNLMLAMNYLNISNSAKKNKISNSLNEVGLSGYEKRKIFTLSGGEQQRVAIARLFVNPKKLILADEPTGSLDPLNRNTILEYLKKLNQNGSTILIVTHDESIADLCDKKLVL
jgi:putative bacteriocin ABC transporter